MKLKDLKKAIDKAWKDAEHKDVDVEVWNKNTEYEIIRIGQFGVVRDVVLEIKRIT